jgi:hypothetical protein
MGGRLGVCSLRWAIWKGWIDIKISVSYFLRYPQGYQIDSYMVLSPSYGYGRGSCINIFVFAKHCTDLFTLSDPLECTDARPGWLGGDDTSSANLVFECQHPLSCYAHVKNTLLLGGLSNPPSFVYFSGSLFIFAGSM